MRPIALYLILLFLIAVPAAEAGKPDHVPGQILIAFNGQDQRAQRRALAAAGARELSAEGLPGFFRVAIVPQGQEERIAARLRLHRQIRHAEPNYIFETCLAADDPDYEKQWHFLMINLESAWQTATGSGVTVAVVDTGVRAGTDGFGDRLLPGYNAFWRSRLFWEDKNFHGTHVAGTIAQETNNGIGGAGVAYDAWILPVKVLGTNGRGTSMSVARGIVWAVDNGADIINMSLGGPNRSLFVEQAVAYAYEQGVTLIAATGNEGRREVFYPAAFDTAIAVGALDRYSVIAGYSNYGPEVDLVAPGGTGEQACFPLCSEGIWQETFIRLAGIYIWGSYSLAGTSMASPHVAGVAALLKQLHPAWGPDEIKAALIETATDLGPVGWDEYYGHGLLNAAGAVTYP